MTPEQISELARSAGFDTPLYDYQKLQLQAFAQLVRNAALEEAAMKCEEIDFSYSACEQYVSGAASAECAEQIRSLKS